ncbi:hypothetical protein BGZ95_008900 [Linnemannia exigua]|uniref:HCP-like protein n=1 Tax=Linnemannia exigua TaxID=604196 RepID=A0AAD4DDN6_9FUNG|nr:hypothetical protein BGZ95_008900 [Linnemannia exigua]
MTKLHSLQPPRFAAVPNTVLDVIIDTPAIAAKDTPSDETATVQRSPVYGLEEAAMDNYSHIDKPLAFLSSRGPQAALGDPAQRAEDTPATDAKDTPSNVVLARRRGPQHGSEDTAMGNSSHMDHPLYWRPQAALGDQAQLAKVLHGNHPHLRGPQSPAVAAEKDVAQLGISASRGDSAAQIALGDMYRDGNGVPRDDQSAFDWYHQAAEQGDPIGQIRLGELYQYGQGVPQDYEKSLEYYLMAANRGCIRAQREVADFHYNGRGVPKDYVKAMGWYRKAADQGDAGSQCKVGSLYEYGGANGIGYDHLKAAEWYQKAADQGHAFAKKCLRALKDKGMPDK